MLAAVDRRMSGGCQHSCEESSEEELSVLPRHTKVVVTGNNRTKSVLVGLHGVVKKAVGLGGWHWLVIPVSFFIFDRLALKHGFLLRVQWICDIILWAFHNFEMVYLVFYFDGWIYLDNAFIFSSER